MSTPFSIPEYYNSISGSIHSFRLMVIQSENLDKVQRSKFVQDQVPLIKNPTIRKQVDQYFKDPNPFKKRSNLSSTLSESYGTLLSKFIKDESEKQAMLSFFEKDLDSEAGELLKGQLRLSTHLATLEGIEFAKLYSKAKTALDKLTEKLQGKEAGKSKGDENSLGVE